MDVFLLIVGFFFMIFGIIGAILPVLPGPILGWIGLLILHFSSFVPMNYTLLGTTFAIALLIFILDYFIPAMGAKKFGGSKKGAMGATIGLLIGLILPIPLGFVIGAFVGALIGELIHDRKNIKRALKSAFGSFIGFLTSVTIKLLVSTIYLGIFINESIEYWDQF